MKPLLVAVDMGYGHLRAAHTLGSALGVEVRRIDQPPIAGEDEVRTWKRSRTLYETISRLSQVPTPGRPLGRILDGVTAIAPLHPRRDLSRAVQGARTLNRLISRGLGKGLVRILRETGAPLLTTFYAPAVIADRHGLDGIFCVVTDADIHRVWAPIASGKSRIRYLAPTHRVVERLAAYGVPRDNLEVTGFPLPNEGPAGKVRLAGRIARLDPKRAFRSRPGHGLHVTLGPEVDAEGEGPPTITFVVGGAGAQAEIARDFLPSLARLVRADRLRLNLVAGVRRPVAERFTRWVRQAGLSSRLGDAIRVVHEESLPRYFEVFDRIIEDTDLLWTKPSELVFYGALGLPMLLCPPVGVQERYNMRWLVERGAGIAQRDPHFAADWLEEWLDEGILAAAAWTGYTSLPRNGTHRIISELP